MQRNWGRREIHAQQDAERKDNPKSPPYTAAPIPHSQPSVLGSQWVTALARSRRSARNVEPAPRGVQADEVGLLVLNGTTAALPLPARVASISPIRRSSS